LFYLLYIPEIFKFSGKGTRLCLISFIKIFLLKFHIAFHPFVRLTELLF